MSDTEITDEPKPGQVWKWLFLWATITKVGPKQIEYVSELGERPVRVPRERFLRRFHLTGLSNEDS